MRRRAQDGFALSSLLAGTLLVGILASTVIVSSNMMLDGFSTEVRPERSTATTVPVPAPACDAQRTAAEQALAKARWDHPDFPAAEIGEDDVAAYADASAPWPDFEVIEGQVTARPGGACD